MNSSSSSPVCQNPQCPQGRRSWMRRWKRPQGIWLNKNWYCSLDCFEQASAHLFSRFHLISERNRSPRHRLPIGLLMLSKGFITHQHLQEALTIQRESQKGRLGECLRQLGMVTEEQLTAALGTQWGYPVFHLAQSADYAECATMAPLHILESSRMVPVHFLPTSRTLYMAFSDGIDFPALRALEEMLECSTQPCVIGETEMTHTLSEISRMARPPETVLECPHDPQELAHATRNWVESNQAEQVRAVRCPECVWIRIESPSITGHLIYRLQEAAQPATL